MQILWQAYVQLMWQAYVQLRRHKLEMHKARVVDTSLHSSTCVDPVNGKFLVSLMKKGRQDPVHVINKTWGNTSSRRVECSSKSCSDAKLIALQSQKMGWACEHVIATHYCSPFKIPAYLGSAKLKELVAKNI